MIGMVYTIGSTAANALPNNINIDSYGKITVELEQAPENAGLIISIFGERIQPSLGSFATAGVIGIVHPTIQRE
jgi:hypothetical protein